MNGLRGHFIQTLRLHFRNRLALIYGYLFPVIFLAAFWVLYRHEPVPLLRHMGELLAITVLGGACFGLPTTLVAERERGVWRRYRLLPTGLWRLVLGTVLARYAILLSAGALQLGLALAVGLTPPEHPIALFVAFTGTAVAFMGLGLVIALLADTVPAVQALGQCIFLPMLILGGVAVPLASLPAWAVQLSAFFPGRYAVAALQAAVNGGGPAAMRFDLFALVLIGVAGLVTGTSLFRWDNGPRASRVAWRWLLPALAVWVAVGLLAGSRTPRVAMAPDRAIAPPAPPPAWTTLTEANLAALDFNVPPDSGIVTPIAGPDDAPDETTQPVLDELRRRLPGWPPGRVADPVQRVRNLLAVAGVIDLLQHPAEPYVPLLVLDHLEATTPRGQLIQQLAWIALHPEDGEVQADLDDLGLGRAGQPAFIRERVAVYAVKFVARLTGRETMATPR